MKDGLGSIIDASKRPNQRSSKTANMRSLQRNNALSPKSKLHLDQSINEVDLKAKTDSKENSAIVRLEIGSEEANDIDANQGSQGKQIEER